MSVLSSTQKRRRRFPNKVKLKSMGDHDEFLSRIKKTLYYGKIPFTERFSLPVSELAAEIYTNVKSGHRPTLERLCIDDTAEISRNACVSPCSLILALFYLERLKTCNPDYIDRVSPSELFVVSMMVASKFLHDDGEEDEVFNSEWANSAGIELDEINRYEKEFLNAINWEVFVNETAFWTGLKGVEREVARREGRRRGWFSYTELVALLDFIDAWSLAHTLVVVSVVCLTSYTASVMTLVGSAIVASQINVPALIVSSGLRQQTQVDLEPINILKDNFDFNNNNVTCFDKRSIGINEEWAPSSVLHLSSSSVPLSSWDDSFDSVKESNDSYHDIINGFFRYENENVHNDRIVINEAKSDVIITNTIMKMMRVALEKNDRLESRNVLMNYFQESSAKTSATAIVNAMSWLNNLLPISKSGATPFSSSSVNVPSLDVTL